MRRSRYLIPDRAARFQKIERSKLVRSKLIFNIIGKLIESVYLRRKLDRYSELVLDLHNELRNVERIKTEVGEMYVRSDRLGVYVKIFSDDINEFFFDLHIFLR